MAGAAELPRVGLPLVTDLAWGTHLCMFFQTTEDVLEALTPYFKAGLEDGEYCIWVVSGKLTKERAIAALRQAMPDLDRYLAKGSLDIIIRVTSDLGVLWCVLGLVPGEFTRNGTGPVARSKNRRGTKAFLAPDCGEGRMLQRPRTSWRNGWKSRREACGRSHASAHRAARK